MKNIIIQTISLVNSESQLFQLSTKQRHTSSCQQSETQISKSVAFKTQELVFKIFHWQKTSSGSQKYYCKQEKKVSFCVSVLTTVMYTDKNNNNNIPSKLLDHSWPFTNCVFNQITCTNVAVQIFWSTLQYVPLGKQVAEFYDM